MERVLGNLLRWGVTLSAAVVLFGLILHLIAPGAISPDYLVFTGERADLHSIRGIWQGTLKLQASYIIQLGLLLLLATPVARVALSVLAFACQKDKVYVLVTLIVLFVLGYSLMGNPL